LPELHLASQPERALFGEHWCSGTLPTLVGGTIATGATFLGSQGDLIVGTIFPCKKRCTPPSSRWVCNRLQETATNECMCCNKCVHVLQQMCACVATHVCMCCNKCVHVLQQMCACVATNVRMCCNKCVHLLLHLHVILPLERLGFKIELQCVSQCALQCVRFIRVGGLGAMF